MKQRILAALTALFVAGMLVISGCSQQRPTQAHHNIQSLPFSVVATGDSGVDMRNASTFAWARGLQQTGNDPAPGNAAVVVLLQEAIITAMQGKGYRFSAVPGEGDLVVHYKVTLDEPGTPREQTETDTDQLQPSLNLVSPDPGKYEKGSLVIELTERSTGIIAWRSALQGFANLELSDSERSQRIGLMVDRMLAGVPAK
jgi:hypothetical protein